MKSKVLNWYDELIGKTIKAIEIDSDYHEVAYIITEDSKIFAFVYDGFDSCIYKRDERDILKAALTSPSFRKTLFETKIITEEQYSYMIEEEKRKEQERLRRKEENDYKLYLRLKEKFENQ